MIIDRAHMTAFAYQIVSETQVCLGENECTWAYIGGLFYLKFINRLCPIHGSMRSSQSGDA